MLWADFGKHTLTQALRHACSCVCMAVLSSMVHFSVTAWSLSGPTSQDGELKAQFASVLPWGDWLKTEAMTMETLSLGDKSCSSSRKKHPMAALHRSMPEVECRLFDASISSSRSASATSPCFRLHTGAESRHVCAEKA